MTNVYGYVRVSSTDQNVDRQLDAMAGCGVLKKNIYIDRVSGKDFEREQYQLMVQRLQAGDLLFIVSIDRLGRNYEDVMQQWRVITKDIGADICVIDMPLLDTRTGKDLMGTFIADLVLQILSFVAHTERDHIKERQKAGIAAARERGVVFGRPKIDPPDDFKNIIKEWEAGKIMTKEAVRRSGLSRSTFYRRVQERLNEQ